MLNSEFSYQSNAAKVIRKLIDGQDMDDYIANLREPWKEIARNIAACPESPSQRSLALEASLAQIAARDQKADPKSGAANPVNSGSTVSANDLDGSIADLTGAEIADMIRNAVFAADVKADLQPAQEFFDHDNVHPLPKSCRIDPLAGATACHWLDTYIKFSKEWSPRGYEGFHEGCGAFILSTIAARRPLVHLGKPRYPSLYIALTARTSSYSKSTTAGIALATLKRAGLDHLLMPDNATPQKFLMEMKAALPEDFAELDEPGKKRVLDQLAFAAQRGWFYDEFGQGIASMMRREGPMTDFRGLLRRFDDTPDRYESGTVGRGTDVVERPYLAMLASLTPADLAPFAQRGSSLWGDGFLARFALITPPTWARRRGRFPKGERIIPEEIYQPLQEWHQRLNLPRVELIDEKINGKDGKAMSMQRVKVHLGWPNVLELSEEVYEAFYAYDDGLNEICNRLAMDDLDGNYSRFSEKALRLATLFASFANSPKIQFDHWARAQTIAESWRFGLHFLHEQLNTPRISEELETEDRILRIIKRLKSATVREIRQYSKLPTKLIYANLEGLEEAGLISKSPEGRTVKFVYVEEI